MTSKSMSDFRPWNRVILDWDIGYQGYQRDDQREGPVDFQVRVVLREAMVRLKDPQTGKKRQMPGYRFCMRCVLPKKNLGCVSVLCFL